MKNTYKLFFDGASRGNPGLGGCGISLEFENKEIGIDYKYLGNCTNNFAEYSALELGLKKAIDLKTKSERSHPRFRCSSGCWCSRHNATISIAKICS